MLEFAVTDEHLVIIIPAEKVKQAVRVLAQVSLYDDDKKLLFQEVRDKILEEARPIFEAVDEKYNLDQCITEAYVVDALNREKRRNEFSTELLRRSNIFANDKKEEQS